VGGTAIRTRCGGAKHHVTRVLGGMDHRTEPNHGWDTNEGPAFEELGLGEVAENEPDAAEAPGPHRRGRHRRPRRNPLVVGLPMAALLVLAVSLTLGGGSSDDPATPTQPSREAVPDLPTEEALPTRTGPATVSATPSPTAPDDLPAERVGEPQGDSVPPAGAVVSSPTETSAPTGTTGHGNKPAIPPGQSRKSATPSPP
jgi:hypothetical protein